MNEQIRLLAKKAGITVVPEPFDDASRSWNNTMEKFAELIVAECAEICLEANDHKNILRHFGVEE